MKQKIYQILLAALVIFSSATLHAQLTVTNLSQLNCNCFGASTGGIMVSVTGGVGPLTYSWNPAPGAGQGTFHASGLTAGTYDVMVTDSMGHNGSLFASITQPTAISLSPSSTSAACGSSNGSASVSPTGGTGAFSYSWTPGANLTAVYSFLSAGIYTCYAKDANGCPSNLSISVTNPNAPVISTSTLPVSCFGTTTGSASVSVTTGTAPFTYSWSPGGSTTATDNALPAGAYQVTVTDQLGCKAVAPAIVTGPAAALVATVSATGVLCTGQANGTATVAANGGLKPYSYSWSIAGGSTTAGVTSLAPGAYTCMVTDGNGCTASATGSVTQPAAPLTSSATSTNVLCFYESDGTAKVTPAGGTPPYQYMWSPTQLFTASVTGLPAGNYSCTVTDTNGCSTIQTVSITQPSPLTVNTTAKSVTCFEGSNGAASAQVTGGVLPYTYSWSMSAASINGNGSGPRVLRQILTPTDTISNLVSNYYVCYVTDSNGCTYSTGANIQQPSQPVDSLHIKQAACGSSNGAISAYNVLPYTYSWSTGAGNVTSISNLHAGLYVVTITNPNGCVLTNNVTVADTMGPLLNNNFTNVNCFGALTGTASVTVNGGTAPYTYSWSPGIGITPTITNLAAGNYTATVSDANGCQAYSAVTIIQPATALIVPVTVTNVTCNGEANGSATVNASGGTGLYTYSWTAGSNTSSVPAVGASTYTCIVMDGNGCTDTAKAVVAQPGILSINATATNVTCYGLTNGIIHTNTSGGNPPYSYTWPLNASTADSLALLAPGTYDVFVTDNLGCSSTQQVSITQPASALTSTSSFVNVKCNGAQTGSASVTAAGGTGAYAYSWSNGGTSATIIHLVPGTYTCSISDANSCTSSQFISISQPLALQPVLTSVPSTCFAGCNGTCTISTTGGSPVYTYSWSPVSSSSSTIAGLCANTYSCWVTDASGCRDSVHVALVDPAKLTVSMSSSSSACSTSCNGTASSTVSGGTGTYQYAWTGSSQTTPSITALCAGQYTLTVTDANVCQAVDSVIVTAPPPLVINLTGVNATCSGCDGSETAAVSGGAGAYSYSWGALPFVTATATALCGGTYTCIVTDGNACTQTATSTLTQSASPHITGTVIATSSGAVSQGWAYLVLYDTILKRQQVVDSVTISAGRYTFTNSVGHTFLVYAVPDTTIYPGTMKTYAGHAFQWDSAQVFNAPCGTADTANITVFQLAPMGGSGVMSGTIQKDSGFVARVIPGYPSVLLDGDPVPGLDVNLEQHPGTIIAHQNTNSAGAYSFTNIPVGTFEVLVDIPGLGMVSQYVRTVTSNQVFTNLNYMVDSTHIFPDTVLVTAIKPVPLAPHFANSLSVSPNPFKDQLNIRYTLATASDVVVEIYNVLGEKVALLASGHQDEGLHTYQITASEFSLDEGVYMVRLVMGGTTYTNRIVSIR